MTMNRTLTINNKIYLRSKDAAVDAGYTSDYVTRLAREGKIIAEQVGRQWFVDPKSLEEFLSERNNELDTRKEELSRKRKQERKLYRNGAKRRKNIFAKAFRSFVNVFKKDLVKKKQRTQTSSLSARIVDARLSLEERVPGGSATLGNVGALAKTSTVLMTGLLIGIFIHTTDAKSLVNTSQFVYSTSQEMIENGETIALRVYQSPKHVTTSLEGVAVSLQAFSLGAFFSNSFAWVGGIEEWWDSLFEDSQVVVEVPPESVPTSGLVVAPANEYSREDMERVRNSFSDEVEIAFDPNDPSVGVVRPVFREKKGEDYRFLIIPVESNTP